jgi:inorganic phosphate transporter, PiT family
VEVASVAAVVVFCLVTGANDGAAVAAMSARVVPSALGTSLLALTAAVVTVPLVTVRVAVTLAERLVGFEAGAGATEMLVAVGVSVGVVGLLAVRGEPTSLTLALVGALSGAGFGAGLSVAWAWLWGVLLTAAAAPFVAALFAAAGIRIAERIPARRPVRTRLRLGHRLGFALQVIAFATNDAQKMLAVAAIALPGLVGLDDPSLMALLVIGALFLVGAVGGLRRVGRTLSDSVLPMRPPSAVAAELSSGTAVLLSSAVGAPVSMTQSVTGGLLGSSVRTGYRRVRWGVALGVVRAWVVTLPAAFLGAALFAAAIERWM